MGYLDEFKIALERTKTWGLWCRGADEFVPAVGAAASPPPADFGVLPGPLDVEERIGNCAGVHFGALIQTMGLGWKHIPTLTIGNVDVNGKSRYQVSRQTLRHLLQRGASDTEVINLHIWLTFPDTVVVDLALGAALTHDGQPADLPGIGENLVISGIPDTLEPRLRYRPLLVGEEFLFRIGALEEVGRQMLESFRDRRSHP